MNSSISDILRDAIRTISIIRSREFYSAISRRCLAMRARSAARLMSLCSLLPAAKSIRLQALKRADLSWVARSRINSQRASFRSEKGKLPHDKVSIAYSLEYGVDEMEVHKDAITPGQSVILIDDLIATGGTAVAAAKLLQGLGAHVEAACFVIDLPDLGGAQNSKRSVCPCARSSPLRAIEVRE